MDIILQAIGTIADPVCLSILFIGVLFGTVIGALPGLGSILALTVCLPMTLALDSASAFGLLLGTYCGAIYGGSIASILINVPGTPQSAATNLDGYPMAQRGMAGEALGWATTASCMGGIISCIILIIAASWLAKMSTIYGGPIEICALICMGLACIATLSEGNQLKGLMMGIFGLFLSTIGMDPVSSEMRFTFGSRGLSSGIDLLPFIVGLFPLSEVFFRTYQIFTQPAFTTVQCKKMILPSLKQWKSRFFGMVRSAIIGTAIGILPGTGAAPAAFISYSVARGSSKNGNNFGQGEPDGIIAAETANNAVTGGAMVPTLALGIPGDAETSLMLAALTIHQITPGVRLMADNPVMVYCIFILLICANLLMIPAGMLTVRSFGKLLKIPNAVLLGMIILSAMIGSFITRNNFFDLWAALIIGVVAFGFRLGKFPLAPALIGYILGPQLEYRYSQVVIYREGTPWPQYLMDHPLALVLFIIVAFLLIKPWYTASVCGVKARRHLKYSEQPFYACRLKRLITLCKEDYIMKRIMFSLATILSLFGIIGASPAQAAYPERSITMIVPFGAGGATDVVARFIAAHMEKRLGKTIVVKNVVGTGGILGMAAAAEAKPDGYTIAFAPIAPLIMHPAFRDTPYTLQDMCSIARATNDPLYLEVSKNSPIRNMADMAAAIKADPDNQFYGHVGVGSQIHLSLAHIFSSMGLKLRSVTMKDDPEAMQAMAAGRIQYYTSLPSLLARYDIRAIAVLSEERNPATPDIPTAKEQGVDIVYTQWMSLVGPKGIPDDIINILATTFEDVCKDPEYIKDLATLNTAPAFLGPEENQKFMEEEQAAYTRIINEILKPML